MMGRFDHHDLLFLIETLMPGHSDPERAAELVRGDETLIEAMLDDDRLFQRLLSDDEILLRASPSLFFTVLLRRARRDLAQETFTVERRSRQKVVLFDTDRVIELLEQDLLLDYMAGMLASFTRVRSVTVPIRVRQGVWYKYRVNDLDVDSLMRTCGALGEESRFDCYRRIADVCLFMAGMFPEYIEGRHRYPLSRRIRPGARGRICGSLEEYEVHGRAFYRLAAEHERAGSEGLTDVLALLSQHFVLAEKPLTFLARRYLQFVRHGLFDV